MPIIDGHMIGGTFLTLYGLNWVILTMWIYMKLNTARGLLKRNIKKNNSGKKTNSESLLELNERLHQFSWLPLPCCSRLPLEPALKIFFSTVGIIVELGFVVRTAPDGKAHILPVHQPFHVWNDDGSLDSHSVSRPYHTIVYFAFLLSGIIDILVLFVNLPNPTSRLFLFIAFFIEGMLFVFHNGGKNDINSHIHTMLNIPILICIALTLARVFHPTNFVLNLGLGCSLILLGCWFIMIGYILNYSYDYQLITNTNTTTTVSGVQPNGMYNVQPDQSGYSNHGNHHERVDSFQMYITACFASIVISIAVLMIILWVVLLCIQKSLERRHNRCSNRRLNHNCCQHLCQIKWIAARDFVGSPSEAHGYLKVDSLENQFQAEENEAVGLIVPQSTEDEATNNC